MRSVSSACLCHSANLWVLSSRADGCLSQLFIEAEKSLPPRLVTRLGCFDGVRSGAIICAHHSRIP